jgi:hypothetical protein
MRSPAYASDEELPRKHWCSVDFGRWLGASSRWSGFKLAIGATNIFDEKPSFAYVGDAAGFDMSQGDLKQRALYLRLEKSITR